MGKLKTGSCTLVIAIFLQHLAPRLPLLTIFYERYSLSKLIDLRSLGTIFLQFLVEKLIFQVFEQKSIFDLRVPFLVKNEFFIIRPKIDLRSLGTIFGWIGIGRKMIFRIFYQVSILDLQGTFLGQFWSKKWTLEFWPPVFIFGRQIEICIFRPKIDLRSLGTFFLAHFDR